MKATTVRTWGALLILVVGACSNHPDVAQALDSAVLVNTAYAGPTQPPLKDLWKERSPGDALPQGVVPMPSLAPLVKTLKPGVVNVYTTSVARSQFRRRNSPGPDDLFEDFWRRFGEMQPQESRRQSLGSGFIINPQGYVITNNHVVEGATEIRVKLSDAREIDAQIVGRDPKTDVALLKLKGQFSDLPFVYLGNSDVVETGDFVVAVGNPFGLDHSVSQGIVSAKERVIGAGQYDNFIQTDAAINPGNSGGPLFNTRGEVVGVNTAIVAQGQGIGFAVPVNMVKALLPQLLNHGKITRGWLGVTIQDVTAEIANSLKLDRPHGALIAGVMRKGPADSAGLKPGDVVVAINGKQVDTFNQLSREVAFLAPNTKVQLGVLRDGKAKTLEVKVGERPDDEQSAIGTDEQSPSLARGDRLGMIMRPLSSERAAHWGLDYGVQVAQVKADSAAARSGIRAGDVLVEMQRQPIQSVEEYQRMLGALDAGQTVLLRLQRENASIYVAVRIPR